MNSSSLLPSEALPLGFQFAAVTAGIKPSGNPDFAIALADRSAHGAAMFTSNRIVAAPLTVDRNHLERGGGCLRAVVVNSGNANCATGDAGLDACYAVCSAAAETFACAGHEIFPSSTGIIGVPLSAEKLIAALPAAMAAMGATPAHFDQFARAILTTDTRAKIASASIDIDGVRVRLAGVCKGAGMIHPQLVPHATMLVYLFTDADALPTDLAVMLQGAADASFNRISIDGDTSTNDTVLLLASGASGAKVDSTHTGFQEALTEICVSLAKQIVDDGEGVTHVVELQVEGALTDSDALRVAKSIAHSPLVKTAWAGSDPNWGRLLAAIGNSGTAIDPGKINIWFGDQPICADGGRAPEFDEAAAHAYLEQRHFTVRVDLGVGSASTRFWTTDLTVEYVHINADYST